MQVDPDGLKEDVRSCIREKLAVSEQDCLPNPDLVTCSCSGFAILPKISIFDLYNYLVRFSDQYSHSKLKNYKNTDGYKLFLDGYVISLSCGQYDNPHDNFYVVRSRVKPKTREKDPITQRPYYQTWMILQGQSQETCVKCGFCSCKGGCVVCYPGNFVLYIFIY